MKILEAFHYQADACERLGSPFMRRLLHLLADRMAPDCAVTKRISDWPGNASVYADSLPLRTAGALHALKLQGLALNDVYPPHAVSDDVLWSEISLAFRNHETAVIDWLESAPQTNEVRRSATIIPVIHALADRYNRPIELMELGASGGLNLRADLFRLDLAGLSLGPSDASVCLAPEWIGPTPDQGDPKVIARAGVDLNPIDPASAEGRLRLLAYLWPDQPDRLERTDAAITVARTHKADVDTGDAGGWLAGKLSGPTNGACRLIFHTIAWQYFPDATKLEAKTAIMAAAENATLDAPLAHFAMEADSGDADAGALLTLHLWPENQMFELGRADFHGRWIRWAGLPDRT